jgi:hypothetical protein
MRYVVAYGKRAKKQWLVCSAQCIPPDRGNFDGHVDEEPLGILPSRRHRQKKMCVNSAHEHPDEVAKRLKTLPEAPVD